MKRRTKGQKRINNNRLGILDFDENQFYNEIKYINTHKCDGNDVRYMIDDALKKLSKHRKISPIKRNKEPEKMDYNLFYLYGKYIISNLKADYITCNKEKKLGIMLDKDNRYDGEFVWKFVVPHMNNLIYIKIKFIKNKINVISFHKAKYEPKYYFN